MLRPQKHGWCLACENGDGKAAEKEGNVVLDDRAYVKLLHSDETIIINMREKLTQLQNELYDYQYHMGLLLIEKKEWTSNYENLEQALAETKHNLKQKQSEHQLAMCDMEKREDNLMKALGVEKQCVADLEKALHKMHSQYAEIKFTSDMKLVEANDLVTGVEEKTLDVESKLRAADAKHYDLSKKNLEIGRKSHEVDVRENALQRERLSFTAERQDLWERERRLQEGERRLEEVQRSVNQRERLVDENDRICKQKQIDLEDAKERMERASSYLKKKEDDMSKRVEDLTFRDKDSDTLRKSLEMKEKKLLELEKKLNIREQVEVRRLVDEHNTVLKSKNENFELEMEKRRKALEDELKSKVVEVDKKEGNVKGAMEEKVAKREQELDKIQAKLKEKEKESEFKFKDLEEKENSFRDEVEKLEKEKKKLILEEEQLFSRKSEFERYREDIEEQQQRIDDEREMLKVAEEEKLEHSRLQFELKRKIDKYKSQKKQLLKEKEGLKQERDRFEKEWEDLDEKKRLSDEERDKELKEINNLREAVGKEMEKMRLESSRIENEKQDILRNQNHLDEQQLEMRRKHDELVDLSNKLKEVHEQFLKEKEHFLTLVENHKSCKHCGHSFPEFDLSNLQSLSFLGAMKSLTLPHLTEINSKGCRSILDWPVSEATSGAIDSGSPTYPGTMSWLHKCASKMFTFSPGKKYDHASTNQYFARNQVNMESPREILSTNVESELQFKIAEDKLDPQKTQSNDSIRDLKLGSNLVVNEHTNINSEAPTVVDNYQHSDKKLDPSKCGKRSRGKADRRHTVKTIVTNAKLIQENAPTLNKIEHNNDIGSVHSNERQIYINQPSMKKQRKQSYSRAFRSKPSASKDSDYTYSGGDFDTETAGGRRKRQKVVPPVQTTSGPRYNLRQRKILAKPDLHNGKDKEISNGSGGKETVSDGEGVNKFSSAETEAVVQKHDTDAETVLSKDVDWTERGSKADYENQDQKEVVDEIAEVDETDKEAKDPYTDYKGEHPGEISSISSKLWNFLTT